MPKRQKKTRKYKGGARKNQTGSTSESESNNNNNNASSVNSLPHASSAARNARANMGLAALAGNLSPISHHSNNNNNNHYAGPSNLTSVRRRLSFSTASDSKHGDGFDESDSKVPEDGDSLPQFVKSLILHDAVERGDLETLKETMTLAEDVETPDRWGKTLLIRAAENGHIDIMKFLLEKGAKIDAQDGISQTVFLYASKARKNTFEMLSLLLDTHMQRNTRIFRKRNTNLNSYKNEMKKMLNEDDTDGNTPLMILVQKNDYPSVKLLLQHGAAVAFRNSEDRTPLMEAARHPTDAGLNIIRELLLHMIMDINQSVILPTSNKANPTGTLSALQKELDFFINYIGSDGRTATQIAESMGNTEVVKLLKYFGGK